jgi:hypothetical protein
MRVEGATLWLQPYLEMDRFDDPPAKLRSTWWLGVRWAQCFVRWVSIAIKRSLLPAQKSPFVFAQVPVILHMPPFAKGRCGLELAEPG